MLKLKNNARLLIVLLILQTNCLVSMERLGSLINRHENKFHYTLAALTAGVTLGIETVDGLPNNCDDVVTSLCAESDIPVKSIGTLCTLVISGPFINKLLTNHGNKVQANWRLLNKAVRTILSSVTSGLFVKSAFLGLYYKFIITQYEQCEPTIGVSPGGFCLDPDFENLCS